MLVQKIGTGTSRCQQEHTGQPHSGQQTSEPATGGWLFRLGQFESVSGRHGGISFECSSSVLNQCQATVFFLSLKILKYKEPFRRMSRSLSSLRTCSLAPIALSA